MELFSVYGILLFAIILIILFALHGRFEEDRTEQRWKKYIKITDTSKFNSKNLEELNQCILGCRVQCELAGFSERNILNDSENYKKLCLLYDAVAIGYIFGCIGHFEDEDVRVQYGLDTLRFIIENGTSTRYAADFWGRNHTPKNRIDLVFEESRHDVMVDIINYGQDESQNNFFWSFIEEGEMNMTFKKFENFKDCINAYCNFDNSLEKYRTLKNTQT